MWGFFWPRFFPVRGAFWILSPSENHWEKCVFILLKSVEITSPEILHLLKIFVIPIFLWQFCLFHQKIEKLYFGPGNSRLSAISTFPTPGGGGIIAENLCVEKCINLKYVTKNPFLFPHIWKKLQVYFHTSIFLHQPFLSWICFPLCLFNFSFSNSRDNADSSFPFHLENTDLFSFLFLRVDDKNATAFFPSLSEVCLVWCIQILCLSSSLKGRCWCIYFVIVS